MTVSISAFAQALMGGNEHTIRPYAPFPSRVFCYLCGKSSFHHLDSLAAAGSEQLPLALSQYIAETLQLILLSLLSALWGTCLSAYMKPSSQLAKTAYSNHQRSTTNSHPRRKMVTKPPVQYMTQVRTTNLPQQGSAATAGANYRTFRATCAEIVLDVELGCILLISQAG